MDYQREAERRLSGQREAWLLQYDGKGLLLECVHVYIGHGIKEIVDRVFSRAWCGGGGSGVRGCRPGEEGVFNGYSALRKPWGRERGTAPPTHRSKAVAALSLGSNLPQLTAPTEPNTHTPTHTNTHTHTMIHGHMNSNCCSRHQPSCTCICHGHRTVRHHTIIK